MQNVPAQPSALSLDSRVLLDSARDFVAVIALDGTVIALGAAMQRALGPRARVGETLCSLAHDEDAMAMSTLWRMPGGGSQVIRMPDAHGAMLLVEWLSSQHGQCEVVLTGRDITHQRATQAAQAARGEQQHIANRQLLEQGVVERTRQLTQLLEVAQAIASTPDLLPLLTTIFEKIRTVVGFCTAYVLLPDEDGGYKIASYAGPLADERLVHVWPIEVFAGMIKNALEYGQAGVIDDLHDGSPTAAAYNAAFTQVTGQQPPASLRSQLVAPLTVNCEVIGLLVLEHAQPGAYAEQDAELIQAIANQSATAIENARLKTAAVEAATMAERSRIARELHDSVSQALFGIVLGLRTGKQLLESRDPERARLVEAVDYSYRLAESALAEMRALVFELRPESLEEEGLVVALRKQSDMLLRPFNIHVETQLGDEPALPLPVKEGIYRIAVEAMRNVAKHAEAAAVRLVMRMVVGDGGTFASAHLVLRVIDNGRGFDVNAPFVGHYGLKGMRERAAILNGQVEWTSSPASGTVVTVTVPLA